MSIRLKLCKALLAGDVLSIMDGFRRHNITNVPREIPRLIEKKFGVMVSRTSVKFKADNGETGYYFEYRLNHTEYNQEGIRKMVEYVLEHDDIKPTGAKTDNEFRMQRKSFLTVETIHVPIKYI